MPSSFFARNRPGDLQDITVEGGTETYTDGDGIDKERALADVDITNVAVQPGSGSSRLVPEGVRQTASYTMYVDLSTDAATKRARLVARRKVTLADSSEWRITWVGDWTTHLMVTLQGD